MRRPLAYLIVWTVVTAVTVGASWLGIRSVLFAAAPSRATPLSAAELRQAVPTGAASTPVPAAITSAAPPPASSPPAPSPTRTRARTVPSSPATPSPAETWQAVPDGRGSIAYTRTLHARGGEVSVWCASWGVRVLSVRPVSGYQVVHGHLDFDAVGVSFVSATHVSRIYAAWREGPTAEVTESVE